MKEIDTKNYQERDADKTLEVLFEISKAVTTTQNLDELYQSIHKSLGKIINVDNFFIALHHEKRDSITFPYYVDEKDKNPGEIFNFSKTASLTGRIISAGKPLIFFEPDIIGFAKEQNQKIIGTASKILIGAPLVLQKRIIGVVALQSFNSAEDYTADDLSLLNAISQHIALAIERKESHEKVKDQRLILEKILESSPVGIGLVENRVFKWVNNEMVKILGYDTKQDFKNANVRMIYNTDADYKESGNIIYKSLKDTGRSDFDYNLKKNDGTIFKAHLIITSPDSKNPLESTIATIADISRRDLAQKEKLEKQKLQGVLEMAGAVCHEINQPLQAILGYATLYQDDDTISSDELTVIKTQAKRIGQITKKLAGITEYKTKSYPGDTQIVDIWGSSNDS